MIIDLRVYTYVPTKFRKFLQGYQEEGFALTSRHLGKTLGIFTSESGLQNRTFQFFMYEDAAHRYRCRVGMRSDPAWSTFIKIDGDALLQQHNTLLVPVPAVPLALPAEGTANRPANVPSRIFELQTLSCVPDACAAALEIVKTTGVQLFARHAIELVGAFCADTGDEDSIMTLCVFADDETREAQRAALHSDPDYREYLRMLGSLVSRRDTTLLLATPYSPLQ
jgi:hypothetical protein